MTGWMIQPVPCTSTTRRHASAPPPAGIPRCSWQGDPQRYPFAGVRKPGSLLSERVNSAEETAMVMALRRACPPHFQHPDISDMICQSRFDGQEPAGKPPALPPPPAGPTGRPWRGGSPPGAHGGAARQRGLSCSKPGAAAWVPSPRPSCRPVSFKFVLISAARPGPPVATRGSPGRREVV